MKTGVSVADAMTYNPITISPDASLEEAARIMKENGIGSLIIKQDSELLGIITEWDIVRKVVAASKNPKELKTKNIMVRKLITITPNRDLYEALVKMRDNDIKHLPVVKGNKLVGFLTLKDVLKIQPELFDILIDKIDVREAESKPINEDKFSSGTCAVCGKFSKTLLDINGMFVCRKCREMNYENFK